MNGTRLAISAIDPIGPAWNRMVWMLFRPFSIGKWFTLGFCAFLASLGEGGGGNFNIPRAGGGGPVPAPPGGGGGPVPAPSPTPAEVFGEFKQLFLQHAWWIVPVAIVVLVLGIVVMWVRARGKFMFLEGVAYNRAAVVEPWKRLRPLANSYFWFDLLLSILMLLTVAGIGALGFAIALPDIRAERFDSAALTAILVGGGLLLIVVIVYGILMAMAEDFVIPLMYLRGARVGPAWGELRSSILRGHVGVIVLFYLMQIVFGIAAMIVILFGTCVTCCVGGLPYLSSVLFLPVFVFLRAYSLCFLRQFGEQYNLVMEIAPPPQGAFPVLLAAPPAPAPQPPPPPSFGPSEPPC